MKGKIRLHSIVLAIAALMLFISLLSSTAVARGEVNFIANPYYGYAPLTVNFFDATSSSEYVTSWLWDFGDGTSSRLKNPTHTYYLAGTYKVTLYISTATTSGANSLNVFVYQP